MVHLNRIYTKSGDGGQTSLGDGTRVSKTNLRIQAYGTVDELNSILGVTLATDAPEKFSTWLKTIQNDLFDLGADLCVPETEDTTDQPEYPPLRVTEQQATKLEFWIDEVNENLQPLNSFILPGGSIAAAHFHVARTVCRRAEIAIVALTQAEQVNPHVLIYLNRLSDLLFVLARACNDNGAADVLWQPGQHRND